MTPENQQKVIEHFLSLDTQILMCSVIRTCLENANDQDLGKAMRSFIQPQINTALKND